MPDTVFRDVEVDGQTVDVHVRDATVVAVGDVTPVPGAEVVEGHGGALLPGLHDHHLHLLAMAAAASSVDCGVHAGDPGGLAAALRSAPGTWVRAVGYHERTTGRLDREVLDAWVPDRPVRVQHRSGALWMLNSPALALVDHVLDHSPDVERDAAGRPTGRLWRYDTRLRPALPHSTPDLAPVGRTLLSYGITGITDATPDLDADAAALIADGALPQQLLLLGVPDVLPLPPRLRSGPYKLHLRDHDLPPLGELTEKIAALHSRGRAVAVHCVTAESLLLTVAALRAAGPLPGDRIEHASVVLPGVAADMARLGVAVVTQPGFVYERGDDYLATVEPGELPYLYPYRSLLDSGLRVAPSSDGPHASCDPWRAIAAADRITVGGSVLGPAERVGRARVLAGYLSSAEDPGGAVRRVCPGTRADLCLLHVPLREALAAAPANPVRLTMTAGCCT
ncbi:amidohydrolase family protein [Streptomyces sp. NY05-11A]|uniref:amidohydrolase family protein n=1 Tax=Streptomyces soliscabiei TaxID=588897 RepID=UPI0029A96CFB|nr:amidohydrolase family protein [Streptomyces sp. NY05-11A]MDX2676697.1 amidohydrolase family protein [Streptomyces sp. NY05-11A]